MSLKAIWANNTPYSKTLLSIGVILICTVLFTLTGMILASAIFHVSILELQGVMNDLESPQTISILKFLQTFSEIGTFIVPALILAWFFDSNALAYLKLSKGVSLTSAILVVVLLVSSLPLINFIGELNARMSFPSWLSGLETWMRESEDLAARITEKFLDINTGWELLFALIMIALLPAIGEELIFRGLLQRIFSEWAKNIHIGIWLSAILFSAMHMQFYGFIPRMLLGVMMGYLMAWSGSLWLPIIAHFVNNAAAVILTYLFKEQMIGVNADKIGTENDYSTLLLSALITAAILWTVYKRGKKSDASFESSAIE